MRSRLKPGRNLCLSVQDFDHLLDIYRDSGLDVKSIIIALMGGQEYAYHAHRVIFTRDYLGKLLLQTGSCRVYEWTQDDGDTGLDVNDWSRRPLMLNGRSYTVSLNPEAER